MSVLQLALLHVTAVISDVSELLNADKLCFSLAPLRSCSCPLISVSIFRLFQVLFAKHSGVKLISSELLNISFRHLNDLTKTVSVGVKSCHLLSSLKPVPEVNHIQI